MLHHLSFAVLDLARSAAFYDVVLSALGLRSGVGRFNSGRLWAACGGDKFAIKLRPGNEAVPGDGFHVAFAAPSRDAVVRFHAAAIRHGGRDNGVPELCREYGPHYYAGFIIDPDGYRIEAVIAEPAS